MKINNIFRKSIAIGVVGLALCSCEDFLTITPTDKTVEEDFWKNKNDVDEMVTGTYKAMLSSSIQQRAIIWGDFRSDELVLPTGISGDNTTALKNINAVNLLPSNTFCSWGAFYSVINDCNIVLKHAPSVMNLDPEFTEGDYEAVQAQMLALRSLCYFYLVRSFRDVPYNTEAYETDDQDLTIAQSAPDTVLAKCITDLETAETYAIKSGAYGTSSWKNKGYITRDAVDAILADIYLWRASLKHSSSDYEKCVEYCEKIIAAKTAYYEANQKNNQSTSVTTTTQKYPLEETTEAFINLFVEGNADESIFELQYDGNNNSNEGLAQMYYQYKDGGTKGYTVGSSIFNTIDANANTIDNSDKVYTTTDDYRFWQNCYEVNDAEQTELEVRKMVEASQSQTTIMSQTSASKLLTHSYSTYKQNWIIYRLSDILLMEAEAKVQLATSDADASTLRSAFNLVKAVNTRSLVTNSKDSLDFTKFGTKDAMERLVLAERQRELCFEGKRWFDLMRYNYRHVTAADPSKTLAQLSEEGTTFPTNYSKMLAKIIRKYTTGGDAVSYKLKNEAFLYFPIATSELKVNSNLKQNPVYVEEETTTKN
jgi:starch-binding outer membrane protein, SusD/RagB family